MGADFISLLMWIRPLAWAALALVAIGCALRDRRLACTAGVLFAAWVFCTVLRDADVGAATAQAASIANPLTGPSLIYKAAYPAWGFFIVDYISALVILFAFGRPTLWQVAVAAIFGCQIVMHVIRCQIDTNLIVETGLIFLRDTAWLQILIIGGWVGYGLAYRLGRVSRGSPRLRVLLGSDCAIYGRKG